EQSHEQPRSRKALMPRKLTQNQSSLRFQDLAKISKNRPVEPELRHVMCDTPEPRTQRSGVSDTLTPLRCMRGSGKRQKNERVAKEPSPSRLVVGSPATLPAIRPSGQRSRTAADLLRDGVEGFAGIGAEGG